MKLSMKPLNPWIVVEKDGKVIASHCDCQAGLGEACTHIASLLYAVDGTVRVRDSRTVTQEPAYWLLPASVKKVSYAEVRDINFSSAKAMKKQFENQLDNVCAAPGQVPTSTKKARKTVIPPTDDDLQLFYGNLHKTGKKSSLLSVIPEYADHYVPKTLSTKLPPDLTALRENEAITLNFKDLMDKCNTIKLETCHEEIENLEIATREQSKSNLWFQFRAGRITASKMKAVTRTDPSYPAESLIKSVCYPVEYRFETEATKWGTNHEKTAVQSLLCKLKEDGHENVCVENCGVFVSEEYPFIGASPDSIVSCECCGKQLVEVKCPFTKRNDILKDIKHDKAFFLKEDDSGELKLDSEHEYFYQIQTQMGVTKVESCLFVVWTSVDLHVEQILFDEEKWQEMARKADHFFRTAVLPELVGKFYTRLPGSGLPLQPVASTSADNDSNKTSTSCGTEDRWCYCDQVEFGEMVCCDNENCDIKWFHFECLNLKNKPKSKTWYCPDCRKIPEFSRKRFKKSEQN